MPSKMPRRIVKKRKVVKTVRYSPKTLRRDSGYREIITKRKYRKERHPKQRFLASVLKIQKALRRSNIGYKPLKNYYNSGAYKNWKY